MGTFNIDNIIEEIEIQIDGKNFKVALVTEDIMAKVTELSDEKNKDDPKILSKQLALFLGTDKFVFEKTDVRKLGHAIQIIIKEITKKFPEETEKPIKKKS